VTARRRRRRRAARVGCATVAGLALLAGAVVTVVTVLGRSDVATPKVEACVADVDGTRWRLSPAQAENAALIAGVTVHRGLPARAATVGIATALQESKLVNLDYGDRDSLGLFQQRPSQGWGTAEQILDPVYATGKFLDVLVQVDGYEDLPITEAAQAVQRSGFPEAYAEHEPRSRAFASALTGWSPAALTCELGAAEDDEVPAEGAPAAFLTHLSRDLGDVRSTSSAGDDAHPGGTVNIDAGALGPGTPAEDRRLGWALAHWGVAVADGRRVTSVATDGQVWTREGGTWAADPSPVPAGVVRVTFA
jgi:hypothetical protein